MEITSQPNLGLKVIVGHRVAMPPRFRELSELLRALMLLNSLFFYHSPRTLSDFDGVSISCTSEAILLKKKKKKTSMAFITG